MNRWHHNRLVSALQLLAMLPFEPIYLKEEICEELGLGDRPFRRLVEAINDAGIKIESMHLPDGSGVSYYRSKSSKKTVDTILMLNGK